MHRASTCDTLRKDLASLGNILLELFYVLVIDGFCLIRAELAYFLSSHAAASSILHHIMLFSSLSNCQNGMSSSSNAEKPSGIPPEAPRLSAAGRWEE